MTPWESVNGFFPSIPYWELVTPMAADVTLTGATVDVVDLLAVGHSSPNFGSSPPVVYEPSFIEAPDPRCVLHWVLYATAAAFARCPGDLIISTGNVNPVDGLSGLRSSHHIPYSGSDFMPRLIGAGSVAVANESSASTGSIVINGRYLSAFYRNGGVAQTTFLLGLYLRAL